MEYIHYVNHQKSAQLFFVKLFAFLHFICHFVNILCNGQGKIHFICLTLIYHYFFIELCFAQQEIVI